ncbi:CGNR zinc finger domain-containing protein [Streptomyces sp. NPDC088725]|uniref:CGNR zinc finger domain-containing protein n=1 Tax=Streptomyces sp. NPDC088725 TaxID=3365873 RepID=UPI0037FFE301
MSWSASERYGVRQAPDGFALVQELINTRAIRTYAPDLLIRRESAEEWLTGAAEEWSALQGTHPVDCSLSTADLAPLRDLRAIFTRLLSSPESEATAPPSAPGHRVTVQLVPDTDGQVRLVPVGAGRGWLESALWSEALLAQRAGIWPRLKVCRNPECGSSFYDTSRNNSGVWHDVRTCGNAANLRASRLRKRMLSGADGAGADGRPPMPAQAPKP